MKINVVITYFQINENEEKEYLAVAKSDEDYELRSTITRVANLHTLYFYPSAKQAQEAARKLNSDFADKGQLNDDINPEYFPAPVFFQMYGKSQYISGQHAGQHIIVAVRYNNSLSYIFGDQAYIAKGFFPQPTRDAIVPDVENECGIDVMSLYNEQIVFLSRKCSEAGYLLILA